MDGQEGHLLRRQPDGERLRQIISDALGALVVIPVAPDDHGLELGIIILCILALCNALSQKFEVGDEPPVIQGLVVQRNARMPAPLRQCG